MSGARCPTAGVEIEVACGEGNHPAVVPHGCPICTASRGVPTQPLKRTHMPTPNFASNKHGWAVDSVALLVNTYG